MKTVMSKTEPNQLIGRIGSDIQHAARLVKEGHLVAIPTETVYGLGADATSDSAINKLYKAKGRPDNHPVIVHIHSLAELSNWAQGVNEKTIALGNAFWPGPLTIVLKKKEHVSSRITGGQSHKSRGHRKGLHRLRSCLYSGWRPVNGRNRVDHSRHDLG